MISSKRKKVIGCVVFLFAVLSGFTACKNEREFSLPVSSGNRPTTAPIRHTPMPTPVPAMSPEELHPGMKKSLLNGEWMPEEEAGRRPYAVVFNNINIASPQSGIGDADILYEALVEAGITRLMGIYEKIEEGSEASGRLGSIRSARHYFLSIASEYDAIFVAFGATTYADRKQKSLGLDSINGIGGYGVESFYRDNSIKAPHNAFASLDGILKGISKGKLRTERKEDVNQHFDFYEEDTDLGSGDLVEKLVLPFSSGMQPYFLYHEDEKAYTRYQFGGVHIDANTDESLTFKNIIIQLTEERDIDKNGYQTMDFEDAAGKGFYITNGEVIPITWEKKETDYFMQYYDTTGEKLKLNAGKTYIAIFPSNRYDRLVFEG